MVTKFRIQNYKSILDNTIELGKVNVLIGENGSGKSNVLEAFAMLGASLYNKVEPDDLYGKGIRVTNPTLTKSAFNNQKNKDIISFNGELNIEVEDNTFSVLIQNQNESIFSEWEVEITDDSYPPIKPFTLKFSEESFKTYLENIGKILDDVHDGEYKSSDRKTHEIARAERKAKLEEYEKRYTIPKSFFTDFLIYDLNTKALRGIFNESRKQPVGINGEGLDILISSFNDEEIAQLKKHNYLIGWLDDFFLDKKDLLKFDGMKMGKSTSLLYFQDRFMTETNNVFSAENANEGILHILFYLSVLISKRTPQFFGIDNIETALNPHLCRHLMKGMSELAIQNDKQIVVTTHNPAILDGLDLTNDDIRLFEVYRGDNGDTRTRRIQVRPGAEKKHKLSEMWMRGVLGAISKNF